MLFIVDRNILDGRAKQASRYVSITLRMKYCVGVCLKTHKSEHIFQQKL